MSTPDPNTPNAVPQRYEVTVFHIGRWTREHYGYAATPEAAKELHKEAFRTGQFIFPQTLPVSSS